MTRYVHWYVLSDRLANASCFFCGILGLELTLVKITKHPMEDASRIQFQISEEDWKIAQNYRVVMELYGWIDDSLWK